MAPTRSLGGSGQRGLVDEFDPTSLEFDPYSDEEAGIEEVDVDGANSRRGACLLRRK